MATLETTCPAMHGAAAPSASAAIDRPTVAGPRFDVDIYSDAAILEPYGHYRALRDLGGAVFLPRNRLWAIPRYADVREALRNPLLFSSANGVAANEATNTISTGNLLASDPPTHTTLRKVVAAPLLAPAMNEIRERIETAAETLVERLVTQGSFDAMSDFAQVLPVAIVSDLVGLPEEGRQNMLRWASATFDMLGGDNARAADALPVVREMRDYTLNQATPDKLKPNSWAARLYEAADRGVVPHALCPTLMRDYLGPSLDTTIFATGHLMLLFGRHPEQWARLRADPSLIPNAINETIRLESPIRGFTRYLTAEHEIDGVALPAASRVLLLFASANRDERKWREPERFDITRVANDHLGFGHGIHACAGMQLARLEMRSLLAALVKRVERIEIGAPVFAINNVLRGLERLPVRVVAA